MNLPFMNNHYDDDDRKLRMEILFMTMKIMQTILWYHNEALHFIVQNVFMKIFFQLFHPLFAMQKLHHTHT
jgi:hypothetical protein